MYQPPQNTLLEQAFESLFKLAILAGVFAILYFANKSGSGFITKYLLEISFIVTLVLTIFLYTTDSWGSPGGKYHVKVATNVYGVRNIVFSVEGKKVFKKTVWAKRTFSFEIEDYILSFNLKASEPDGNYGCSLVHRESGQVAL